MIKYEKIDLTGKTFGRLIVIKEATSIIEPNTKKKRRVWWCRCNCGNPNLIKVRGENLSSGITKSCGCLRKEYLPKSRKQNEYILCEDYYKIFLINREFFVISKEDFDIVSKHYWFSTNTDPYIYTSINNKHVGLSRFLFPEISSEYFVDHINGNVRDNRRCNLRIVTPQQNTFNSKLASNNTSGYKGVYWKKDRNKWKAEITYNHKVFFLGYFDNKEDAIAARKAAEEKYYGEYSYDASQELAEKNKIIYE